MPEEVKRVGEGIAERLNSGPAREELKRPEWPKDPDASWNSSAAEWHAYALSLEGAFDDMIDELEQKIAKLGKVYRNIQGIAVAAVDGKATAEHAVARIAAERNSLRAQAEALAGALEGVLKSAVPNKPDHPTMSAAWPIGQKALDAYRAGKENPCPK